MGNYTFEFKYYSHYWEKSYIYKKSIRLLSQGLSDKLPLDPAVIDSLIFGNLVVNAAAPNIAHEIIFNLNFPPKIACSILSMACISGLESIAIANKEIQTGESECIIAGGVDSLSNGELTMPRKLTQALGKYQMVNNRNIRKWKDIFDFSFFLRLSIMKTIILLFWLVKYRLIMNEIK